MGPFTDTEFWSVCQHAVPAQDGSISYLTLSPGDGARCQAMSNRHDQMNLYHVVGVNHGYIGGAPTQLKVEEHARHTFMSLTR